MFCQCHSVTIRGNLLSTSGWPLHLQLCFTPRVQNVSPSPATSITESHRHTQTRTHTMKISTNQIWPHKYKVKLKFTLICYFNLSNVTQSPYIPCLDCLHQFLIILLRHVKQTGKKKIPLCDLFTSIMPNPCSMLQRYTPSCLGWDWKH